MAFLSAIFTALSRKVGDLLQALFGWSVAALFGRLNSRTQVFVTIALVLAMCWPVFVLGVFLPAAATFVIAFVPIESPTVRSVLRGLWIVLAIGAPLIVALLVRVAAPLKERRGIVTTLLNGYPLTLGMALSFVVTLVTVPLTRLVCVVRRWESQHIYVQPREGRYDDVLSHLVDACRHAGLEPRVEPVPKQLSLSIRVLRAFSRGAVGALLIEDPRRISCDGLQAYLYPADLLLQGEPKRLALVRAALTSTMLERDAWLVRDTEAQELQGDLCRLRDVLSAHANPGDARSGIRARLVSTMKRAAESKKLTFEDWLVLDRMARRLEAELNAQHSVFDEHDDQAPPPSPVDELPADLDDAALSTLVTSLVKESQELLKLEAALAKQEATEHLGGVVRAVVAVASGIALVGAALAVAAVGVVMAVDGSFSVALAIGGGLALAAGVAGVIAWGGVPRHLLERTRHRLGHDWRIISERAS